MDENLDFARIQVFVQLFEQKTCTKNCTTVSVVIENHPHFIHHTGFPTGGKRSSETRSKTRIMTEWQI